jgi:hypothetical protein
MYFYAFGTPKHVIDGSITELEEGQYAIHVISSSDNGGERRLHVDQLAAADVRSDEHHLSELHRTDDRLRNRGRLRRSRHRSMSVVVR